MEDWTKEKYSNIIKNMLKRSARSLTYRQLVMSNPREAFETVADINIPDDIMIHVVKEDDRIKQIKIDKLRSRSFYWDTPNDISLA
ncbi:MAG: hypothetical protein ACOCWO_05180 [Candidatus Muiribacteriaceae bacterium]